MLQGRSGTLGGHVAYARVRCAAELLESLGLLLKPMRATRAVALRAEGWTTEQVLALGCVTEDDICPTSRVHLDHLRRKYKISRLGTAMKHAELGRARKEVGEVEGELLTLQASSLVAAIHFLIACRRTRTAEAGLKRSQTVPASLEEAVKREDPGRQGVVTHSQKLPLRRVQTAGQKLHSDEEAQCMRVQC